MNPAVSIQPSMKYFQRVALLSTLVFGLALQAAESPRAVICRAILTEDATEQRTLIMSLIGQGDEAIEPLLAAWRSDSLFVYKPDGTAIPVLLTPDKDAAGLRAAFRVDNGQPLLDAAGKPLRLDPGTLTAVEHTSGLRRAMKNVLDLIDLASPDLTKRIQAIQIVGQTQDAGKLAALQIRLPLETHPRALRALREAVALIQLKDAKEEVRLAALAELKTLSTLSSADFLKRTQQEAEEKKDARVAEAARVALLAVESHRGTVDFLGTIFRGLSLGSILLVLA
ncbi:MAG: urea ABC transporter permease subunit UrtB, partial [Oleiharenicola lentus]